MVKLHGYSVVLDHRPRHSLRELGKDLEKIRHHHEELKRVKAYERKLYYEHLDLLDHEREAQHNAALDAAAAYYDQVRQEAEEDLRKHLEEERLREDKETRRRLREYREETALYEKKLAERREAQRTQEEEARKQAEKAVEAERAAKAAEAEKVRKAAEAEKAKKAVEEEKLKKAAEAEKLKKAAEAEKARKERDRIEEEQRSRQTQNIPEMVIRKVTLIEESQQQRKRFGIAHLPQSEINTHQRYLQVHQNLKGLRKNLREEGKKNASFRQLIGDMRRSIVKCVGQLREGKNANKNQVRLGFFSFYDPS
jgi:nucleoporin GLE1